MRRIRRDGVKCSILLSKELPEGEISWEESRVYPLNLTTKLLGSYLWAAHVRREGKGKYRAFLCIMKMNRAIYTGMKIDAQGKSIANAKARIRFKAEKATSIFKPLQLLEILVQYEKRVEIVTVIRK